jgi:hypothetical protein
MSNKRVAILAQPQLDNGTFNSYKVTYGSNWVLAASERSAGKK